MRNVFTAILGVLLSVTLSVNAQVSELPKDTSTHLIQEKDIYTLITAGQEIDVKSYFKGIAIDELIRSDSGSMVRAISKLKTNDKITRTIWILEEVKNRTVDIKYYVYTELERVDYRRPSFVLRQLINNYFTNYNETETALLDKVNALQKKMNR